MRHARTHARAAQDRQSVNQRGTKHSLVTRVCLLQPSQAHRRRPVMYCTFLTCVMSFCPFPVHVRLHEEKTGVCWILNGRPTSSLLYSLVHSIHEHALIRKTQTDLFKLHDIMYSCAICFWYKLSEDLDNLLGGWSKSNMSLLYLKLNAVACVIGLRYVRWFQ